MRKLILFLFLFTILFLNAEWINLPQTEENLFQCNIDENGSTRLVFSLDGYEQKAITENAIDYLQISYALEGEQMEVGRPSLPQFSRLLAVHENSELNYHIVSKSEQIVNNVVIYPFQKLLTESSNQKFPFTIDQDYYQSNELFPQQQVEMGKIAIMRDFNVAAISFNPFQYDPARRQLKIITRIEVSIDTNSSLGSTPHSRNNKRSKAFEPLYSSALLNYDNLNTDDVFQQPSYLFIHPDNNQLESTMQVLFDWKREMGYEVQVASTSVAGTNFNSIKSYIQNIYNTSDNPPEFICLIGDAGVSANYNVPTDHMDGGEGDQGYVRLDGTDILADAFIGRLSIGSVNDLQTIVYKILNYEKMPHMTSTDWYRKAVMIGDPSMSGHSTVDTKRHVKDIINNTNPQIVSTEVYNGNWVSNMSNNINNGVAYFNYRGFGGMSGWNTSYIEGLSNGFMLPVVVAITCQTGDFEGNWDSINESFLKVGSPGNPKGAIAAIATATGMTHTCFNNCVDAGIYYGIFHDEIYNMGGALVRGKLALYQNYPNNPSNQVFRFSYWNNLMGDPGMKIWTDIPQPMQVTYESQVNVGANNLTVNVKDDFGTPLANAWVTALMGEDEIFATGYTNDFGEIVLPIEAVNSGAVTLTVTKHNFIPHLGSFDVGTSDRFLQIESFIIDDDNSGTSIGNSNNIVNPGEAIELSVELKNLGSMAANGVTTTISSNSNGVVITDAEENYGNINSGSAAFSADDFDLQFAANLIGGSEIQVDLCIEDSNGNIWIDYIFIVVEAANIHAGSYQILNDPNGILDPGDTAELVVSLENLGFNSADNVYGILSSENAFIEIDDDLGFFGSLAAGAQANNDADRFIITANSQIIPGTYIGLDINVYNASGYDDIIHFDILVGEAEISDPTGPGEYGYLIYDDEDTGYYNVPVYEWMEINGVGTELSMYDSGDMGVIADISLPIIFKFYGEEYSEATVCSNGWIVPGLALSESFMNWEIPGPLGPSPLIAAFWDDLVTTTNGGVYWYYDASAHRVIIEWDHMKSDYNDAEETFQVILFDSNFYPTSNGDSEIIINYKEINNVDQGSYGYSVEHGAYATVGVKDGTNAVGVQYTFNNEYPVTAKHLEDEMALLITGPPIPLNEPFITLNTVTINDSNGNGQIDYGEEVDLDITLNNLGENPATGVNAVISSVDTNLLITQPASAFNDIAGNGQSSNLTAFSIDVNEDCPDAHLAVFNMIITGNENTWETQFSLNLNAPDISLLSVFVDDDDNGVLDPGETADVFFSYENIGGSDAYNVGSVLATLDEYITLNTASFDLGDVAAGTICTAFFNITAASDATVGHNSLIDWTLNGDLNYSVNGAYPLIISQIPVGLTEDFMGNFPPDGWGTSSNGANLNWLQSSTSNAGGQSPEAKFNWSPSSSGYQRLFTLPINTLGSNTLNLEFKHYINDFNSNYTLHLETSSDGSNWTVAHSWPGQSLGPVTELITIDTDDVGSETFQLSFTFDGDSYNINNWYIDDVALTSETQQVMGFLSGNVVIQGGTGELEDVSIQAENFITHPDVNGDYTLPVDPGDYSVSATLVGYSEQIYQNVSVNPAQSVNLDFSLDYLQIPQNLLAEWETNDVSLSWDIPAEEDLILSLRSKSTQRSTGNINLRASKDNLSRSLEGFNVYRDNELLDSIVDPAVTVHLDEFVLSGNHTYYVCAVYDNGESLASNLVSVNIVLAAPQQLTAVSLGNDVQLNWQQPDDSRSLTGYNLYRNNTQIGVNISETSFTDGNVTSGSYSYYVTAVYGAEESAPSNAAVLDHTDTPAELIPLVTKLQGNFPNPFNPETMISFSLHEAQYTELAIYNVKGEEVSVLVNEELPAAFHNITWKGLNSKGEQVASGIYFYKLQTKNYKKINKMLMLK